MNPFFDEGHAPIEQKSYKANRQNRHHQKIVTQIVPHIDDEESKTRLGPYHFPRHQEYPRRAERDVKS